MKILIAGAGDVGFHLAKLLSYEAQDIYVVDLDRDKLDYIDGHLDVITHRGDVTSFELLREAGIKDCDMFIAVTQSQNTNLTASVIAKNLGAKTCISRIDNFEYLKRENNINFKKAGLDNLISPEDLAVKEIVNLINYSSFSEVHSFEKGKLNVFGITLSKHSPLVDKTVIEAKSILKEQKYMPLALKKHNTEETNIIRGNTTFRENDHIYFLGLEGTEPDINKVAGKESKLLKDIMILGGGKIGTEATKRLCEQKYNIKLLEENKNRAFDLADELDQALVINGDGSQGGFLDEEGIDETDAFVAVTGRSETNIMSCLMAKSKGVKKTIALVENVDYIHLSQMIGIDAFINKKLLAAGEIFKYIRKGQVLELTNLGSTDLEVLEFKVNEDSKITQAKIKDLNFPSDAIIGGVVRGKKGYITLGNFQLKAGDKVVVFALPSAIKAIEFFF